MTRLFVSPRVRASVWVSWCLLVTACSRPERGPSSLPPMDFDMRVPPLSFASSSPRRVVTRHATSSRPPGVSPAQWILFRETNRQRRRHGRRPFVLDRRLSRVAQAHAIDMARRRYFSHVTPEGLGPGARLRKAGIGWMACAENISGYTSPTSAVAAWMRSPGHRGNLLNATYRRIGLGAARRTGASGSSTYFVQVFTN